MNLEWDQRDDLLADFDALRPKLLALYRMTGGNPRLTIMLYELIAHDSITKVREQFQILLDRISPFYQDRLSDLPPQERAILETMAGMRDEEKTPAAIAACMRMNQPQTSALLIASVLKELARWSEAEEHLQKAREEVPSESTWHPVVLNNLAQLLQATNQLADAEPLMREALRIQQASFGKNHPAVAIRLNNLATLLQATNRPDDAEPLIRSALGILLSASSRITRPYPGLQTILANYRGILEAQGQAPEAVSATIDQLIAAANISDDLADEIRAL